MPLTAPTPITKLLGNAVEILGSAVPSLLGLEKDVLEAGDPIARLVGGQGGFVVLVLIIAASALLHHRDHAVGALEQLLDVLWGHPVLVLFTAQVLLSRTAAGGCVYHTQVGNPAIKPGRDDGRAKSQGQDPGVWDARSDAVGR